MHSSLSIFYSFSLHSALVFHFPLPTVAGTVSDIPEPDSGITVVSWSPPVPPNGVILYYNVRISHVDTGELILLVIELYDTEIDLDEHNVPDGMVTVEVWIYMYIHELTIRILQFKVQTCTFPVRCDLRATLLPCVLRVLCM